MKRQRVMLLGGGQAKYIFRQGQGDRDIERGEERRIRSKGGEERGGQFPDTEDWTRKGLV